MSELADVLELMHTSIRRWKTLRARGWEWRHRSRNLEAWRRWLPSGSHTVAIGSEGEPEPEETRLHWRLCLARPDKARAEFSAGEETVTAVISGDTWWSWTESRGVTTNAGDPHSSHGTGPGQALIDPAPLLPAVEVEVGEPLTFIGRRALNVVAIVTPLDEDEEESPDQGLATQGLGAGADEYALVVDIERGVVLRSEARIEGQPFRILEVEAIGFDERLPPGTFEWPRDKDVERAISPRSVSISDLSDQVSFTVLVPEHPPFGIDDVTIHPAELRHERPEQVWIRFASNFFGEDDREFVLIESAEPFHERPGVEWQERGGVRFGEDSRAQPRLRVVRIERLDTHVELQSYYLEIEQLLELAHSLVLLPRAP